MGFNHSASTVKVLKTTTGGVCYTGDILWTVPRTPEVAPAPAVGGG